jgi:hypothetical protein
MNAREFEDFVANVICELDFVKDGVIHRNHRFAGIRQHGSYEIDIAVRTQLSRTVDFLLIIECKNWNRKVDRPIVQKLAQTKDAIAAHKAAIVSPLGFTKEAVEVAKDLGIALWVLSKSIWIIESATHLSDKCFRFHSISKRIVFLKKLGVKNFEIPSRNQDHIWGKDSKIEHTEHNLVDFAYVFTKEDKNMSFVHYCLAGSATCPADNMHGVDERLASTLLVDALGKLLDLEIPAPINHQDYKSTGEPISSFGIF